MVAVILLDVLAPVVRLKILLAAVDRLLSPDSGVHRLSIICDSPNALLSFIWTMRPGRLLVHCITEALLDRLVLLLAHIYLVR